MSVDRGCVNNLVRSYLRMDGVHLCKPKHSLVMLHLCDPKTATSLSQPPSSAFGLDQELEYPSPLWHTSSEFCDKANPPTLHNEIARIFHRGTLSWRAPHCSWTKLR
ncbi:hypothetical protein M404DRAFT_994622 [Pisolithus tinctorius Marx 270]|uniref:Uncharacterized protein n=1 Tax=Pisolithus tinctorius Marx 270 TaxID=870435 RepID=A0A0C3PTA5_PISTI|nr:hypothetical protein M404DRAFT_994622 [Pisolithus tinctorius Marx 270]